MNSELFDLVPLWGLFIAAGLLAWCALEAGYRLGVRRRERDADRDDASVSGMVASILALLAFMLGFTFSLAATRFDSRRLAVLDESNAIGTTYLRARILPQPEQGEIRKLLRDYVDARLRGVKKGCLVEATGESERLHERLWSQAMNAAARQPTIMTSLFIQSLNNVIDLHATRLLVATRNRIPVAIWIALLALAAVGMAAIGYQAGLTAKHHTPAMTLLIIAFAAVLFLIADLDRGQEGFLVVSQQSMIDLQKSMQADALTEKAGK